MRNKVIPATLLFCTMAFISVGAFAQHEEHQAPQGQAEQAQPKSDMGGMMMGHEMGPGMAGCGMMDHGKMGMMSQMTAHHQKMETLMTKVMASMTAIQNEKDPAALKTKIAAQAALLKEMQTAMKQHEPMMHDMSAMMSKCPMMGGGAKPAAK